MPAEKTLAVLTDAVLDLLKSESLDDTRNKHGRQAVADAIRKLRDSDSAFKSLQVIVCADSARYEAFAALVVHAQASHFDALAKLLAANEAASPDPEDYATTASVVRGLLALTNGEGRKALVDALGHAAAVPDGEFADLFDEAATTDGLFYQRLKALYGDLAGDESDSTTPKGAFKTAMALLAAAAQELENL